MSNLIDSAFNTKEKKQNRKNKGCTYMPRSIECAHRKYEKVNVHKKSRVTEY